VTPASGVARSSVTIRRGSTSSDEGLNTKLVHLKNITLAGDALLLNCATGSDRFLWVDNVHQNGGGQFWTANWYNAVYATDVLAENQTSHSLTCCTLIRNCKVDDFQADAFKGGQLVVNSSVHNNDKGGPAHSDVWQESSGYNDNVILYGIDASDGTQESQVFFTRTTGHEDFAIVNCNIDMVGYPAGCAWTTKTNHFVVKYNTFKGSQFRLDLSDSVDERVGYYGTTNAIFDHCVFQWVNMVDSESVSGSRSPDYDDIKDGTTFTYCHFFNVWPSYTDRSGEAVSGAAAMGDNSSTGSSVPTGKGAYGTGTPPWVTTD
jgi:hypothetical protein